MRHDIWKFSLIIIIAGFIGLMLNQILLVMLTAAIGVIAWQTFQIRALYRWVVKPGKYPMRDASGQIYQLHRELHRRQLASRRQKRQLSAFLSQFRKAISALPDAIILIDRDGKIEWANANAKKVLGINWPEDSGVRFKDLIRHPQVSRIVSLEADSEQGIEISSTNSREKTINIKCVSYTDDLRMVVARDVSRLIKVNQMHTDFVANVSHELKTPLTVLRGYLEIIQDNQELPEQFKKPMHQMSVQSVRMHLIVNDLLYLAKLEDTDNIQSHEPVNVAHLVHAIIESVQPLIDEKQHKVELDIDLSLSAIGSQNELHSAFNNLITNAIHYTPGKGEIKIGWRKDEHGATFTVKDNGLGIAKQHISRLTQRFYRVDADRSREGGGTGLGLAIVKHVLQRHDAKLDILSTEGAGSEFVCRFPIESIQQAAEPLALASSSTSSL